MNRLFIAAIFIFLTGCQAFFFQPETNLRYHPDICKASPIDTVFPSADGTALHGWFFRAENPKGTIFYLHGNGQNMSLHIHSVLWLTSYGYNVFAFDYRGYGISRGKPDINGVLDDSLAALDYLVTSGLPDVGDIIVLGQSLGGAAAIVTTANTPHQYKIAALITDCAFASWRLIYRQKAGDFFLTWPFQYPISWAINDDMAPEKYISKIPPDIKVLLVHDTNDNIVPYEHALRLYEASGKTAELWTTSYEGHISGVLHKEFRDKLVLYMNNAINAYKLRGG